MRRAYWHAFARLYSWAQVSNWDKCPEITAFVILALAVWTNVLSLFGSIEVSLRRSLLPPLSNFGILVLLLVLTTPQYLFVLRKGRYKQMTQMLNPKSQTDRLRRNVLTALYLLGSLCIFFVVAIAKSKQIPS